jgi:hypothetical protein
MWFSSTCGLVAMTSASHAEGRQFDPGQVYLTAPWAQPTHGSGADPEVARPRGPMDKASAYGAGDCRFESCRGHLMLPVRAAVRNAMGLARNRILPAGFEPATYGS